MRTIVTHFHLLTVLLFGLIWIGVAVYLRLRKKKSFVYLLFFTVFYIYLFEVLDYTLFQFQELLFLKHFMPNLMLRGVEGGRSINLIPLGTLTSKDIGTSLLNILLMIPFGFGLPFVTRLSLKKVVFAGLLFSIAIELLQLITGLIAHMTFRVADINDVIFNTLGAMIGCGLFLCFARVVHRNFNKTNTTANSIVVYVVSRLRIYGSK